MARKRKGLTQSQVESLIRAEESQSLGFLGEGSEIHENRRTLLDYYNQKPFDVVDGQSSIVSSDVADVVNGTIPNMLKMFTSSQVLGKFEAARPDMDEEADQKTRYANYIFFDANDGEMILHDMIKDAMLQYTGVVKVFYDDTVDNEEESYLIDSELELMRLLNDDRFEVKSQEPTEDGRLKVTGERVNSKGRIKLENIPPDELLISKRARSFNDPPFIGQRTQKTRSELIQMGFDPKIVATLSRDEVIMSDVALARDDDFEQGFDHNPTNDPSKDVIYLGEYYVYMDKDGDGVSELWQVFFSGGKVLEMNRADSHPYAVFVPIPMPHKAIGSCPADQAADIQYRKSHLIRNAHDNIYATNHNRNVVNDRVNLDDLLTPRHGGVVRIEGGGPIGDSVMPLMVNMQVPAILEMINYTDSELEKRTGITAHNQGLDTESLNKTATGFQGIRDMSQMRIETMAKIMAGGALKKIFNRIIKLAGQYQDEQTEIRVNGAPMQVDPRQWRHKTDCKILIGTGSGDKQARIANLERLMNWNMQIMQMGGPVNDWKTFHEAYKRLIVEIGLKEPRPFVNDPSKPEQLLMAENQMLMQQMQQMQQQMSNPLAEAEIAKGQMKMQQMQQEQQHEMNMKMAEMEQKDKYHTDDMAIKLSELEIKAMKDVPGSLI